MSTDVSEVSAASIIIAVMMKAARTSETSVDIQLRTWQYIPEDSELQLKYCFQSLITSKSIVVHTDWIVSYAAGLGWI
jgi:hypothetical protein